MDNLKLDGQLSLGMEAYNAGLRLVVFEGNEVCVCHKVRIKVLQDFIRAEEGRLFKGRLQLDKSGNDILVFVKNNKAGVISAASLKQLMDAQLAVAL